MYNSDCLSVAYGVTTIHTVHVFSFIGIYLWNQPPRGEARNSCVGLWGPNSEFVKKRDLQSLNHSIRLGPTRPTLKLSSDL